MGGGVSSGGQGGQASPASHASHASHGSSARGRLLSRRSSGGNPTLSEINVTPFVDVVLVLLIIFMVTAPMLIRSMDVSLPSATLRRDNPEPRTIVTLDAQGRTYIDDHAVNIELLEEQMKMRVEV